MSDSDTKLVYVGPTVGETVNGRVINATRGTIDGGNFVSFDGGVTYVPVSELGLPAESTEAADTTAAPAAAAVADAVDTAAGAAQADAHPAV